jgi:hypothetical protein
MEVKPRFYLVGLAVAFLEEFITQGILKRTLAGWIIPALIAFFPFLIVVRQIGKILKVRMTESKAASAYYLISGVIGLMIEWLVIGLSPWSNPAADPLLILIFQFGIFSFWGSVAFAPRLLLDRRDPVARVRRWYKRFLAIGFVSIYLATFLASKGAKFVVGISAVLATFIPLNFFYFEYVRTLGKQSGDRETVQVSST